MSIEKRVAKDGTTTWRVKVHVGYTEDGQRRTATRTCTSAKEAGLVEASLKTKVDQGTYCEPVRITLAAFMKDWLDKTARATLKRQSRDHYAKIADIYILPNLGHIPLRKLQAFAIQELYNSLSAQKLATRTIRLVNAVLKSALKSAVAQRIIYSAPTNDTYIPRAPAEEIIRRRTKVKSFDSAQAIQFLNTARHRPRGVVLIFGLLTGARPGEYLGLRWPDLNWKDRTVRIERSLVRLLRGGGWILDTPKTTSSFRTITLPAELMDMLRTHRAQQNTQRLMMGDKWEDHDFIFTNQTGGPLLERSLHYRTFRNTLTAAGIKGDFVLYNLRHTCATLLLLSDEQPKVVAERLGHSSIVTTMDIYAQVLPHLQERATEKLRSLLLAR